MAITSSYKIVGLNPVIEEELSCKREIGNAHNTHAVAARNIIDGDIKTAGHVLRKLSALRLILKNIRLGAWFNPVYCQRELLILLRFTTA